MSYTAEGTIEIDIAEFTEWVYKNYMPKDVEFQLGVPRVNKSNQTFEVDFAMSTDGNPRDWAKTPDAVKQWDALK